MALAIDDQLVVKTLRETLVFLPQSHWLDTDRRRPIWVGRTATLDEDFARLLALLGLPDHITLPPPGATERNEGSPHRPLSERAADNVRAWYAADYALLEAPWLSK